VPSPEHCPALLQGLDWAQANDEQAQRIALAGQELVKK
jgi:hypothetical protein